MPEGRFIEFWTDYGKKVYVDRERVVRISESSTRLSLAYLHLDDGEVIEVGCEPAEVAKRLNASGPSS